MDLTFKSVDLAPVATLIINKLVALKPEEEILLIADTDSEMAMVEALAAAARGTGAEYSISIMPSRIGRPELSNVLPKAVECGFLGADVVIGLTRGSFAPSCAPIQMKVIFEEKRCRYISMAFRSIESMLVGGALADYDRIRKESAHLKAIMESGKTLIIRTPFGTDFHADVPKPEHSPGFKGPFVRVEDGWADKPGKEAGFPDGEVFFAPAQFSAEGTLIIDGPIEYVGMPSSPVRVIVEKGKIVDISGDCGEADKLRHLMKTIKDADIIGEVALGMNECSLLNGSVQEEKKALGNAHIGFGVARQFPGTWMTKHKALIHSDMIIRKVDAWVDDIQVFSEGRPVYAGSF